MSILFLLQNVRLKAKFYFANKSLHKKYMKKKIIQV